MSIDEQLRIIGKTTDINTPQDDSLNIGDKFKSLDEYQADANKSARKVVDLENIVDSQSRTIANIKNEMVNVETNLDDLQQAIENADLEDLPDAISALEQAINNLNDALDGIPIYGPATTTEDGLMTSADKIKIEELEVYKETNKLMAGLMSADEIGRAHV